MPAYVATPSTGFWRMAAVAAHLVDGVFGDLPVRQWVLTLPHRLRYALAYFATGSSSRTQTSSSLPRPYSPRSFAEPTCPSPNP